MEIPQVASAAQSAFLKQPAQDPLIHRDDSQKSGLLVTPSGSHFSFLKPNFHFYKTKGMNLPGPLLFFFKLERCMRL